MSTSFFEEQTEQSEIKAKIVADYFWSWAKIMTNQGHVSKLAYIDLFAGPGRYKSGKESTPLMVLKHAIQDSKMRQMLVTIFNDKDEDHIHSLESCVADLPGINTLRYAPDIQNEDIGTNIVDSFESMRMVPTFFFVDSWGYK